MTTSIAVQLTIVSLLVSVVASTPHGAPSSACSGDMAPVHPNITQSNDPAPTIQAAWSTVLPDVVEVTIEAKTDSTFRGYLLVAHMTGMNPHFVGRFIGTTDGHLLDCDGYHANSAVTHANGEYRTKVKAFWIPVGYQGSVTFRATIVGTDISYYWPNLMSNSLSITKFTPDNRGIQKNDAIQGELSA